MQDDDEDRDAILARRARFIAAALAGIAVTGALGASSASCDGDVEDGRADTTADGAGGQPQPCLAPRGPTGEGGAGANGQGGGAGDGGAGANGGAGDGGAGGATGAGGDPTGGAGGQGGAQPCLAPPPRR